MDSNCLRFKNTRPVHKTPLENCTKEQFIEEFMFKLRKCTELDKLIKEANNAKSWTEFQIEEVEVWHEWVFSPKGISSPQPKWGTAMLLPNR